MNELRSFPPRTHLSMVFSVTLSIGLFFLIFCLCFCLSLRLSALLYLSVPLLVSLSVFCFVSRPVFLPPFPPPSAAIIFLSDICLFLSFSSLSLVFVVPLLSPCPSHLHSPKCTLELCGLPGPRAWGL